MSVVKAYQEKGVKVSAPYERIIKVLLAPDCRNVPEITFSHVFIYPYSQTDLHTHDRPELIYVVSGRGKAILGEEKVTLEPDVVMWILPGIKHQVKNLGDDMLKLATLFIPAYTAKELIDGILAAAERDKKFID